MSALTALAILPIVAVTAVGVDSGRVYVENQRVKTASEAGAVAAAGAWVQSGTACTERALSFVEANAGDSTVSDCSTAGTRYSGVVTVSASKDVSALFGNLVGRESTTVDSTASVRVRPVGGMNGLRPTALCENSPGLVAWRASGFSTTQIFSVDFSGTCGDIPGNWGVLDFDGGSNRTVDLQTWINAGYPGLVSIGQEFNGDPGIPSPALNMDSVVGETITVPVFDRSRLQGSTSVFHVSSFVQMEVIAVQLNGSASSRNISVRFKVGSLSGARIGESASNNGVVTWSPCQLDGRGDCS